VTNTMSLGADSFIGGGFQNETTGAESAILGGNMVTVSTQYGISP
jgi:hypothetical protein